jgi:hypothetical protein
MKSILLRFTTLALTFTIGVAAIELLRNGRIFSSVKHSSQSQSSSREQSREQRRGIEDEEYAVYAALINENTTDENINRPLVIKDQPTAWMGSLEEEKNTFYEDLQKSSSILLEETVDDLRAKNKETHTFGRRFDIKRQYILVSEKEIDDIFKKGGGWWEEFYRRYPETRGFVTFSRVGFNADKTQALVYQAHSCGGLCGGGGYVLLVKVNGVWKSKGTVGPVWVS